MREVKQTTQGIERNENKNPESRNETVILLKFKKIAIKLKYI